jgi:hypothetical protein
MATREKTVWAVDSYAPPITPVMMETYKGLAKTANRPVREAMEKLIDMHEVFYQTPPSDLASEPSRTGVGTVTRLKDEEIDRIDPLVPWPHECDALKVLFGGISAGPLRNAAHHLLWFAVELSEDREPLTNDKL